MLYLYNLDICIPGRVAYQQKKMMLMYKILNMKNKNSIFLAANEEHIYTPCFVICILYVGRVF